MANRGSDFARAAGRSMRNSMRVLLLVASFSGGLLFGKVALAFGLI